MIEQVIYTAGGGQLLLLGRSPGFPDNWLPHAERLCAGFGERPAGVACPGCVFAQPFGSRHVAVVQAADQGEAVLGFRLLVLPVHFYEGLGGDPFYIADQFPPDWRAHGDLPTLEWGGAPPARTVAGLQKVLDVPHSAALLGGAQALLDGTRLVFERAAPDPDLLRSLWALLPTNSRREMWPATFAFGNAGQFHALIVPLEVGRTPAGPDRVGYIGEEQAADYPEGNYEWRLQSAIETGDQKEIDALLARRSRRQMIRLALGLLLVMTVIPTLVLLLPTAPPAAAPPVNPAPAVGKPDAPAAQPPAPLGEPKQPERAPQGNAAG